MPPGDNYQNDLIKTLTAPHTSDILNYNEMTSNMAKVKDAVKYWKEVADRLRVHNYPLAKGISNTDGFDEQLKKDAQMLEIFLDELICVEDLKKSTLYDKLRILIAQGDDYVHFKEKMKRLDYSLKCNQIWENDAVAYRCNTCALTPCMSLCESCFIENGHSGHDFTRFFSREGGACDCGNDDVILPQGFCSRHGPSVEKQPTNFIDVSLPEFVFVKLMVHLFLQWRGWSCRMVQEKTTRAVDEPFCMAQFCENEYNNVKLLVEFLQECVNYGGPMREMIARILLDKDLYRALTEKNMYHLKGDMKIEVNLDFRSRSLFATDLKSLMKVDREDMFPSFSENFFGKDNRDIVNECQTLLDELVFWIIRQNFPQTLINFSLGMLSEIDYRDAFAYRFFTWYPMVGQVIRELCLYQDWHHRRAEYVQSACSRIVHISVQMLSSGALCKVLMKECDVVNTVFKVLRMLISENTCQVALSLNASHRYQMDETVLLRNVTLPWKVIMIPTNPTINQHGYWFVMGDMQNLLSHPTIAIEAILDHKTFAESYIDLLKSMQGMHQLWRVVFGEHKENESTDAVQKAYTLEFETTAVTLFNMASAIQSTNNEDAAVSFFQHIYAYLKEWLESLLLDGDKSKTWACGAYSVTFHIPMHRHLSTALSHFQNIGKFREMVASTILKDEQTMRLLIMHPLRIQAARSEINAGMWVRNGGEARMMSLLYSQWNVNSAFQTPDIDLIRYCGAYVHKEWLVECIRRTFYLDEKMICETRRSKRMDDEFFAGTSMGMDDFPQPIDEHYMKMMNVLEREPEKIELVMNFKKQLPPMLEDFEVERDEILENIHDSECVDQLTIGLTGAIVRIDRNTGQTREETRRDVLEEFSTIGRQIVENARDILNQQHQPEEPAVADAQVPFVPILDRRSILNTTTTLASLVGGPNIPVIRTEWLDSLISGMLTLVAELVVIRVNCGATIEEHYRAEMVNCLAGEKMTHSRLRNCISDKGSRGSEMVDRLYDKILEEIADFIEPDVVASPHGMQQGAYQLKDKMWQDEFCPIFCMMRSTSQRHTALVFNRATKYDKVNYKKYKIYEGLQMNDSFWIPFRLIDFDETTRHDGIAEIFKILVTRGILNTLVLTISLANCKETSLHETTLQLAVYLLTMGVKFVESRVHDEEMRMELVRMYHTPFKMRNKMNSKSTQMHTICSFMLSFFESIARKTGNYAQLLKKILQSEFDEKRIYGSADIYFARFLSILVKISPAARNVIEIKLKLEESPKTEEESSIGDNQKATASRNAAKLKMKAKMEAIMAQNKKKNEEKMKKLMEMENITKEEVDGMDLSQPDVKLYDCPICGDTQMPNSLHKPFGMLVKLSVNFLAEEQIDAHADTVDELIEVDGRLEEARIQQQMKTRNYYKATKMAINASRGTESSMFEPTSGIELKTCAHAAHVECFNVYRQSLYEARNRQDVELYCPLCRFTVNAMLPLKLDLGCESLSKKEMGTHEMLRSCIQPPTVLKNDEEENALRRHYGYGGTSGNLGSIVDNRKRTLDATERFLNQKGCPVSTSLLAICVAGIERSAILKRMQIPERRKNTRRAVTEHLMCASVACSTVQEVELTSSLVDKLVPTPHLAMEHEESKKEAEVPKDVIEGIVGLGKAPDVVGFDKDELHALIGAPKPEKIRKASQVYRIGQMYPMLMFEPKVMLTRIIAFVMDNRSLSREQKDELCNSLVAYFNGLVAVRTLYGLMLKLNNDDFSRVRDGTVILQMPQNVNGLVPTLIEILSRTPLAMQYAQEKESLVKLDAFTEMYNEAMQDYEYFVRELLEHVNMSDSGEMGLRVPSAERIEVWIDQMNTNIAWNPPLAAISIDEPLVWKPRQLLRLPRDYDALFSRYFHRECQTCLKSPPNPMVCLLCSKLVCLDNCCKSMIAKKDDTQGGYEMSTEVEVHVDECCSSSGVFLSLNSSLIIIVRGRQASIWGSVYLDAHGEEDRNLRRGKPLSLSEKRFKCLQDDWAEQEWQRVEQWVKLADHSLIGQIKDSHYRIAH